jgi:hypothetical protein
MSTVILSESKSVLAKMLAGENLNVVHRRISTAMIDLKTRTLYLPIWENMDGFLYDLLGGHEVGHALFTPEDGWHSAIVTGKDAKGKDIIRKAFKGVLNVVEDARIEKLIKRKYPGLPRSFVEGYKNLWERDFFGVKKLKDLSSLNLIDRINIYCKCGAFVFVPFNDEERVLVREVETAETWEQVIDISNRLFEKMKDEQDSQLNNLEDLTRKLLEQFQEGMEDFDISEDDGMDSMPEDSEDEEGEKSSSADDSDDEEGEKSSSADDSDDEDESEETDGEGSKSTDGDEDSEEEDEADGKGDGTDEDGEEGDDDEETDKDSSGTGAGDEGSTDEDEPQSITDQKFRERERELVTDAVEVYTYNLPKPALDRIIVPNRLYVDNFYEEVDRTQKAYKNSDPIVATCSKRFLEKNNRYINLLVKEFEMRKNASQYARTTVARTGELDMSKLHKYKLSNDLFRKISVVEKGKSHGMIMYVDMSGSMSSVFGATVEQTLILVAFCRKVGIPFDVYGFSDCRSEITRLVAKKKLSSNFLGRKFDRLNTDNYQIEEDAFHLNHFISSNLSGNHYRRAFDMLAMVAMNWSNKMYPRVPMEWANLGFSLGGTPFIQSIMASRPMIERFKADHKVDITNVIYLSDGDGTQCFSFPEVRTSKINPETGKPAIETHVYLIDRKTKRRIEFDQNARYSSQWQAAMTSFVREVTGCKHIGFYVADSYGALRRIRTAMGNASEEKVAAFEKFWKENGYYSLPNIGYDMYYYVRSSNLNATDKDYDLSEDMTSRKMGTVFSNAQSDKRKHRVLVSTFAKDIAA